MQPKRTAFLSLPLVPVVVALITLLAPVASATTSQINFGSGEFDGLLPGGACIFGSAAPNMTVTLTWRNSNAKLKVKTSVPSSSSGHWQYCSASKTLRTGDLLKASDGLTTRHFTMPLVTLIVDRAANRFHGQAPANSTLGLWTHSGFSDYYAHEDLASNANGRWTFSDGDDVPGGTDAYLDWFSAHGDSVTVHAAGPELDIIVGSSRYNGFADPNQAVHFVLRDPATHVIRATADSVGDDYGYFSGEFRDALGTPVKVAMGDRVVAHKVAADLDWLVPQIEATADVAADTVSGACHDAGNPAGTAIVRVRRTGHERGFAVVGVDASGQFNVDFGRRPTFLYDPANIKHGDRLVVTCWLATGDTAMQSFLVP